MHTFNLTCHFEAFHSVPVAQYFVFSTSCGPTLHDQLSLEICGLKLI